MLIGELPHTYSWSPKKNHGHTMKCKPNGDLVMVKKLANEAGHADDKKLSDITGHEGRLISI